MRLRLIISICAALIPVLAALLLIPKRKKKSGAVKKEEQTKPKEEKPAPMSEKETNMAKANKSYDDYKNSLDEDFKRYAKTKHETKFKPKSPISIREDSSRVSLDPVRPNFVKPIPESKTPIDEFNDSSDELKTLIISGFLDKKDYDDSDI